MVFAFPWLWGLPCAIAGRGAARCGGYRFCAFVVMCRAALRRGRAAAACAFGVSVALAAQLSIIACGLRAEGWFAAAGDVPYGPSSAIGMCAGAGGVLGGQSGNLGEFVCSLHDDVSEHGESSLLAQTGRIGRSRGVDRGQQLGLVRAQAGN